MAHRFSPNQWAAIIRALEADPIKYGLPEGGREKSLVFASFNIRKLSTRRDRKTELDFLARFCARCDLVAIQEVQDSLDGLRYLMERTEAHVAGQGEYALAVSDITGQVPGQKGMAERLAFLYRHHRVRRLDMASDLTFDRTAVFNNFFENETKLIAARRDYEEKLARHRAGTRKTKPSYVPPVFVTFVRTPYVAAFEAPAANDQPPLQFTAVNAHLVYGSSTERRQEFEALLEWLIQRLTAGRRLVAPNFLLLGDLNLDFDQPRKDRKAIDDRIRALNRKALGDANVRRIYFPFLDQHPIAKKVFRTNARETETFDQIGFFKGPDEQRLPNDLWRAKMDGGLADGFDYGVFNFADLFARTLMNQPYSRLSKAQKQALGRDFEHSVSDHLPIWTRIPRPGFV
jgi:endonuclease/exonuclease/phosphatase family metal-dependent hydrolase